MNKDLWEAIATLVGFTVGAGILSIPYVFSKAGFMTGIVNVILLGISVIILNLMLGEVTLRTKKIHQWSGYASKYLGHKGRKIMILFLLLEWYAAVIAYIIKVGEFLSAIIAPVKEINPIFLSIVAGMIGSYLVYKGLSIIEKSEFWMVLLTLFVVGIIGIICLPSIDVKNLTGFSISNFLLPFGVVLFAYGGSGAMPEIREELNNKKHLMKKAIIIGSLISMVTYLVFPLFIVGVTGAKTTEDAIIGLGNFFGYKTLLVGGLFGILTMFTSFLAVGLALKEIFKYDCYDNNKKSSLLACALPFIAGIFIMTLDISNAFYKVIDLSGSILFPLTGILFIFIYWKAKKKGDRKPEYSLKFSKLLGILLIILFLAGLINELIKIFS